MEPTFTCMENAALPESARARTDQDGKTGGVGARTAMPLQDMLELRRFIAVAHHMPGRIRLKIDPAVRANPKAMALAALVEKGGGAFRARLNVLARSLVLEYDPDRIDQGLVEGFFTATDPQEAAAMANELSAAFGLTPQA